MTPHPPTSPIRVGDLLLPTILTLAGRNTASARQFLELFPPGPRSPSSTCPLISSQPKAANP
ncbi:hypothetical protein OHS18_27775 [Amycolatopsis sp. NBC_00355]|uniref:hypothetical protein n=1 Tax=Amycolatopsis sp. NBC_00355 TaxID=2975957 RepID=UPI002E256B86